MGRGKDPDRYPTLRRVIEQHYATVTAFARASGIPKPTVVMVLKGTYGKGNASDAVQRERMEAFLMRDRPDLDLSGLWAEDRPPASVIVDIRAGSTRIHLELPANVVRIMEE
jgi:hypothetical protein